ncbi:endonuclease V [Ambystoma mexicanum]|uniref:endonuclease V n=1 Tax=Ambystoma mexicanum TaxID=8296 RepID=UPI0037E7FF70
MQSVQSMESRRELESFGEQKTPEDLEPTVAEEKGEAAPHAEEGERCPSVLQPEQKGSPEEEEELQKETRAMWEREQSQLKSHVITFDTEEWQRDHGFSGLKRVGGVDLSFIKGDDVNACASLVVLSYPELEVLYEECQMVCLTAPYVAGFLGFREVPSLVDAIERLQLEDSSLMPQILLVDGNGILHHRGFGFACHLGVLTGLPCIGVAKNLLQVDGLENNDRHKEQIRELRRGGDRFCLMGDSGTTLGMALKSCDKSAKPIYVSVGHKISLESAVRLTVNCCKYRTPEPIRQADIRSREYIRKHFPVPELTEPTPPEEDRGTGDAPCAAAPDENNPMLSLEKDTAPDCD